MLYGSIPAQPPSRGWDNGLEGTSELTLTATLCSNFEAKAFIKP